MDDPVRVGPFGDAGSCPACGSDDIRTKYAADPDPKMRITYCLDCLMGTTGTGGVVDMMMFPSCVEQRLRKREAQAQTEAQV